MDKKVLQDVIHYFVAFLGVLFIAIKQATGYEVPNVTLDVITELGAFAVIMYEIYKNKFATPRGQKQREVLDELNL